MISPGADDEQRRITTKKESFGSLSSAFEAWSGIMKLRRQSEPTAVGEDSLPPFVSEKETVSDSLTPHHEKL